MATIPKITYGPSYTGSITFGFPLDNLVTFAQPRQGSAFALAPSGVEDAWITGTDHLLQGDWRWIPTSTTSNPPATGWTNAGGVRDFLNYARNKNTFRYYPDVSGSTFYDAYLQDPMSGPPALEKNGNRRFTLVIRSASDVPME